MFRDVSNTLTRAVDPSADGSAKRGEERHTNAVDFGRTKRTPFAYLAEE
jgi:hypothetical protein